jgi:hypothetical protein
MNYILLRIEEAIIHIIYKFDTWSLCIVFYQ